MRQQSIAGNAAALLSSIINIRITQREIISWEILSFHYPYTEHAANALKFFDNPVLSGLFNI